MTTKQFSNLTAICLGLGLSLGMACGGGDGGGDGEPAGEGFYKMMPTGGDEYDIQKTVLFHNLTTTPGGCCFYSFKIAPDADQQVPDDDPFAQYIDIVYGNVGVQGCEDRFDSDFVYQNANFTFQGTPTRSPAELGTEPLATGTYFGGAEESGMFEFVLGDDLVMKLPPVTNCTE